jgi:murein DD-endopeptidase MepM/ murein hydrolase activator NlpD
MSSTCLQEHIETYYNDYYNQIDDYLESIKSRFEDGEFDPVNDYSSYGDDLEFDITRSTTEEGERVKMLWFTTFHSVKFGNDPDRVGEDDINSIIDRLFTYDVTESITNDSKSGDTITLEIERVLNIIFREPQEIMELFGFDDQQKLWADLMFSVISGDAPEWEDSDCDYYYDGEIIPDLHLGSPFASSWRSAVTSSFGWRTDPFDGTRSFHYGIDIEKPEGTDIMAVLDGTVTTVVRGRTGYGHYVKIDHGGEIETLYAHCSAIYVTEGQEVRQGDVIAAVGDTGRSTGDHLHFELRINGRVVNPRPYLS